MHLLKNPYHRTLFIGALVILLFASLTLHRPAGFHSTNKCSEIRTLKFANITEKEVAGPAQVFSNRLGMKFVAMPDLKISFGLHEVTRSHFLMFASESGIVAVKKDSNGIPVGSWADTKTFDGLPLENDHPVVNVSWEEASHFCEWLSARENGLYRLPTDYEWSQAVGLTKEVSYHSPAQRSRDVAKVYHWGSAWGMPEPTENYADEAYRRKVGGENCFVFNDGYAGPSPVGRFRPNALGIYDMGGNVSEWVYDWYRSRDELKTLRGASYRSGAGFRDIHTIGFRSMGVPEFRSEYVGFRIVVEHGAQMGSATQLTSVNLPVVNSNIQQIDTVYPIEPSKIDPHLASKKKRVKINYSGSDGINVRKNQSFDSSSIIGSVKNQKITEVQQIGGEMRLGSETWIQVEVIGWMPSKVGKSTFLENTGNSMWKVIWNKKGDNYVALRSYPSSESTLVANVNYSSVVEEVATRTISGRHYVQAKFTGWCVKKNKTKNYIVDY